MFFCKKPLKTKKIMKYLQIYFGRQIKTISVAYRLPP